MCLACELQAIWFADLERQGALQPQPARPAEGEQTTPAPASVAAEKFSCDDPTAE
jgi:hypothetical protein